MHNFLWYGGQIKDTSWSNIAMTTKAIQEEISRQLRTLKTQLNYDIATDLVNMKNDIIASVTGEIKSYIDAEIKKLRGELSKINERVATNEKESQQQLVVAQTQAIVPAKMRNEITAAATKAAHDKVMKEINTTLIPRINQMASWVNYQLEDGSQVVNNYRRAVNNSENGDMKTITDGKKDGRVINDRISLFFGDND